MTTKKFISGIMALAMTISLIPTMAVRAEIIPDSTYEYVEDFDGNGLAYTNKTETTDSDTGITYDSKWNASSSYDRWSYKLVKDGDNYYMKYTVKSKPSWSNAFTFLNTGISGWTNAVSNVTLDMNKPYEAGLRVNFDGLSASFNKWNLLNLQTRYGGGPITLVTAQKNGDNWNIVVGGVTAIVVKPKGFVDIKIFFNINGDTMTKENFKTNGSVSAVITYTDSEGKPQDTEAKEGVFSSHHETLTWGNSNGPVRGFGGMEIQDHSNSTLAVGDWFAIDDIYVKEYETYDVTYKYNYEGAPKDGAVTTNFSNSVTLPTPTRDGWAFDGWYQDAACTKGKEFVCTDIGKDSPKTAYAKWVKVHKVTFDAVKEDGKVYDENEKEITSITTTLEKPEEITLPTARAEGFFLNGWYYMDKEIEKAFTGENIKGDMTVYAKWDTAFKVNYNGNGATLTRSYDWGLGNMPKNTILLPKYEGYRFDGWFFEEDGTAFWTPDMEQSVDVQENIFVKAMWTPKKAVSFELNGGTLDLSKTGFDVSADGNKIYTLENLVPDEIPEPKKAGGSFEYWCTNKELTTRFDGTVTENITLYAKYNNVLFSEDFEYTDDEERKEKSLEYLTQLSSESAAIGLYGDGKTGAGIVAVEEDGETNYVLRLGGEINKNIKFAFANGNGGKGLYEVKLRMKNPRTFYIANPSADGKELRDSIRIYENMLHRWDGKTVEFKGVSGWIDITIWYDTENDLVTAFAEWKNVYGDPLSGKLEQRSMSHFSDGFDAFMLGSINGLTGAQLTNTYIDDYEVRKIDLPTVESITTPNDSNKDVPLKPEIRVQFSEKMDRTSITRQTIYLTDEAGNRIDASVDSQHENGKTYATITPLNDLEVDSNYTVNVNLNITVYQEEENDTGKYYLAKPYEYTFTTVPDNYQVAVRLLNEDGSEVTDNNLDNAITLADSKDGKVKLDLKLRNFSAGDGQKYYIGAALVENDEDKSIKNKQLQYFDIIGEVDEGVTVTFPDDKVFDATGKQTTAELKIFIWDSKDTMNSLCELIKY